MGEESAAAGARTAADWTPGRRHYVLAVLCLVGLFNYIDRQVITILIDPIKREFGVSDTAMGALTGVVFAGFYLTASLPLARIADVGSRRTLIAVCLGVWSAMTALGGLAQSFVQLALTRVGVAIGEAGAGPASHSLISDLYPLGRRATMLALLIAIQAVGIGSGVFLGGWLSQTFDWRTAFFIVGVPGVLLSLLIMLTVKEPPRGMSDGYIANPAHKPSFAKAMRRLWGMKSYRCCLLTGLFGSFPGYGVLGWGPTMFIRVHDLSPATVGFAFGSIAAAGLFLGGFLSGLLGDRFARGDLRVYMWIAALGCLVCTPLGVAAMFAPDPRVGFACLFLFMLTLSLHNPPAMAMAQTIAPVRMRAVASVVMTMAVTGTGVGLAPLIIGALNDLFEPRFGVDAIRYSIALMMLGAVASAAASLASTIWLQKDFAATQAESRADAQATIA